MRVVVTQKTRTVLLDVPRQAAKHKAGMRNALHDVGQIYGKEIERLLTAERKTGRKYAKLPNRSSAPGEAPQSQSGRLLKSYNYKVNSPFRMTVGERAKYAGFLEDGTGRMRRRPHLLVAANNIAGDVIDYFYQRSDRELGR